MRKIIFTLVSVAALAATVQASTLGQIIINADVKDSTCDVNVSTGSLNLGQFNLNSFKINKPVEGSEQTFNVYLSNCSDGVKQGESVGVIVNGPTITTANDRYSYFNQTTDATIGVQLIDKKNARKVINSGDTVHLATAGEGDKNFNGKSVVIAARLYSFVESQTPGPVKAPVTFQLAYN